MRRRKKYIKPRTCLVLIGIMLICFAVSFIASQAHIRSVQERVSRLTEERNALLRTQADMNEKLSYARTDDYVIATAREELSMIMPGEIRYIGKR